MKLMLTLLCSAVRGNLSFILQVPLPTPVDIRMTCRDAASCLFVLLRLPDCENGTVKFESNGQGRLGASLPATPKGRPNPVAASISGVHDSELGRVYRRMPSI